MSVVSILCASLLALPPGSGKIWAPGTDLEVSPEGLRSRTSAQESAFHGLVLAAATGQPMPGVEVRTDAPGRRVRTDAEGRFQLRVGSQSGAYTLVLAGYERRAFRSDLAHPTPAQTAIFELARVATLEVAVYDERMRPLAGAEIVIRVGDHERAGGGPLLAMVGDEWRGLTDGRGRHQFAELPVDRPLHATILYEGRTLREIAWPLLLDGTERISVGWVVDRGRERTGVARDAAGDALSGVRLWLVENTDGPFERRRSRHLAARGIGGAVEPLREIVTDEHGAFRIPALPHGWYRLGPAPGGAHVPLAVSLEHDLRDEPLRVELALDLGVTISGRVLGSDDRGIAGAAVFAEQPGVAGVLGTRCDAQGRFALGPVPNAPLRLLARDERFGFETPVVELAAGADDVTLHL